MVLEVEEVMLCQSRPCHLSLSSPAGSGAGGAFAGVGGAEWPLPGQEAFPPELAPGLSPALCVNPNLICSTVKPWPLLAFCVEHRCALEVIRVGR